MNDTDMDPEIVSALKIVELMMLRAFEDAHMAHDQPRMAALHTALDVVRRLPGD
jgi:hypothetical protein